MWKSKLRASRTASAFVLFIALFSTGVVIAHQCHQAPVAAAGHTHLSAQDLAPSPTSSLLTNLCLGVVFLVLLAGGRYLLRHRLTKWRDQILLEVKVLRSFIKPPNLSYALTLPQLGICRI